MDSNDSDVGDGRKNMNSLVQQEIKLHTQDGLSVYQIADRLKQKKNTVLKNLQYYGVLRKNTGFNTEFLAEQFFKKQGLFVVRQKGDAPFDLIVGREFIDVKSASRGVDGRFTFQLQDIRARKEPKDFSNIDWFLIVFIEDELGNPMYKVRPTEINAKQTLCIKNPEESKLPLQFVGYLPFEGALR